MESKIEALELLIDKTQEKIDNFDVASDVRSVDLYEQYDDMLDGCYEGVFNLLPSRILSECDPVGYRCGFADYCDDLDITDFDEYQELVNELNELESELEDLEDEEDED